MTEQFDSPEALPEMIDPEANFTEDEKARALKQQDRR